jgi:arsenical pump membrane protein
VSDAHVEAKDQYGRRLGWLLAVIGVIAATTAAAMEPGQAQSAASQVWSPFVLVGGLLLIGFVAGADGLFSAAGQWLARLAQNGTVLFVGAMLLVAVVTAVLNLDTSVAFLTTAAYSCPTRRRSRCPART